MAMLETEPGSRQRHIDMKKQWTDNFTQRKT
uniref:Uncharacterized protein n=1 Tax=Candidatus Kentrum sp. TC TaxID=2126339 RepID=A0A450Z147_9GAMM|nr:MAG: hypothetical protein BECKTC1821E_GA0114239_10857 [Candidatus Kentron sp. TC]